MQLPFDEPGYALYRIEVVWHQVVVGDGNGVPLLEKCHQFEHAGRVDDSAIEERLVRRKRSVRMAEEEIL